MTKYKDHEFCPLIKGKCVERACKFWIAIRGTNPNTGKEVDEWNCSQAWLPILLIENASQQRQTGAAVESFRNEMVKGNAALSEAIAIGDMNKDRYK